MTSHNMHNNYFKNNRTFLTYIYAFPQFHGSLDSTDNSASSIWLTKLCFVW